VIDGLAAARRREESAVYRLVREAVTNTVNHAVATRIAVRFT
jgi:signal transduction histidine kinase